MAEPIGSRLKHAWTVFRGREDNEPEFYNLDNIGSAYTYRPDRARLSRGNERSIITGVYNRIAIDVAANTIRHVRLDENQRYSEKIEGPLNEALSTSANIDQTGRALIQDAVMSLFDEGCIAIVPTETSINPNVSGGYDIFSLRVARIVQWYPGHVKVSLYNERTGRKEERVLAKSFVAIIENPLYSVMNEPNSTLKRLIRKLNLLDAVDEQSGSGRLDIIMQLPYVIKSESKELQAEKRRKQLEQQLADSKYGVAYIDGTEKITQLNRAAENNLMKQIEYLTDELYNSLGMTQGIFDGTADDKTMLNYYNRTVEPVLAAIVDEMKRKFLTKTARTQGQTILWLHDPFKLVPVASLAEIADKMTRNEIMSPNEIRDIIGRPPANDPAADELRNRNLNQSNEAPPGGEEKPEEPDADGV